MKGEPEQLRLRRIAEKADRRWERRSNAWVASETDAEAARWERLTDQANERYLSILIAEGAWHRVEAEFPA